MPYICGYECEDCHAQVLFRESMRCLPRNAIELEFHARQNGWTVRARNDKTAFVCPDCQQRRVLDTQAKLAKKK